MLGLYFSGTGNTKYCLAQFLHLIGNDSPVYSIENQDLPGKLEKHEEIVLAYPVYFSNLPKIVRDFIVQHQALFAGKKIYIISTMGLFSGDGAGCAARLLRRYGGTITGGLHLKMPDCIADVKALKRSFSKNQQLVRRAERKIEDAAQRFKQGRPTQEGLSPWCHLAGLLAQRLWFSHKTRQYSNDLHINPAKCIGCKTCVLACPMQNLSMVGQKAAAQGKCTMCYRCITNCKQQAITLLGKNIIYQGNMEDYLT